MSASARQTCPHGAVHSDAHTAERTGHGGRWFGRLVIAESPRVSSRKAGPDRIPRAAGAWEEVLSASKSVALRDKGATHSASQRFERASSASVVGRREARPLLCAPADEEGATKPLAPSGFEAVSSWVGLSGGGTAGGELSPRGAASSTTWAVDGEVGLLHVRCIARVSDREGLERAKEGDAPSLGVGTGRHRVRVDRLRHGVVVLRPSIVFVADVAAAGRQEGGVGTTGCRAPDRPPELRHLAHRSRGGLVSESRGRSADGPGG